MFKNTSCFRGGLGHGWGVSCLSCIEQVLVSLIDCGSLTPLRVPLPSHMTATQASTWPLASSYFRPFLDESHAPESASPVSLLDVCGPRAERGW